MELPDIETVLGVKAIFVKAGTAGAIVGAVIQKVSDWKEAITRAIAGWGCAAYLTPLAARWLGVVDDVDKGAMAFCFGLGGMGLAFAIIAILKDPLGSWQRFRGQGGGGGSP